MNSLQFTLSNLLNSTAPPLPSSHLQHLLIRLSRQLAITSSAREGDREEEARVRLLARLEELIIGLNEEGELAENAGVKVARKKWQRYEEDLQEIKRGLVESRAISTSSPLSDKRKIRGATKDDSISSLSELRRKLPPTPSSSPATLPPTTSPFPPIPTNSHLSTLFQKAHTLRLLVLDPDRILPPGKSLAQVVRSTERASNGVSGASTPPSTSTKVTKERLEWKDPGYFDRLENDLSPSFFASTPLDSDTSSTIWTDLLFQIWRTTSTLIPSRMNQGKTLLSLEEEFLDPPSEDLMKERSIESIINLTKVLSTLCAPNRDEAFKELLKSLDSLRTTTSTPFKADTGTGTSQLKIFISSLRQLFIISQLMQEDILAYHRTVSDYSTSTLLEQELTDRELEGAWKREAREREREAIREVVGIEGVREGVMMWVQERLGNEARGTWEGAEGGWKRGKVAEACLETLFMDVPVALPILPTATTNPLPQPPAALSSTTSNGTLSSTTPLPTTKSNILPPILFLSSQDLFLLQNKIQVIVILACLVSLAGVPSPAPHFSTPTAAPNSITSTVDWVTRLHIILTGEVDPSSSSSTSDADSTTKLENLSAEIIAAKERSLLPLGTKLDERETKRIKAGVERIVRYDDPVFKLLKGRCKVALSGALVRGALGVGAEFPSIRGEVIPAMRTGRVASGTPTRSTASSPERKGGSLPPVKGFENPVLLRDELEKLAREIVKTFEWCREVWESEW